MRSDPEIRKRCLILGGLALVTFCLYLPVLGHAFVNYDDQQYVTDNPRVQAGLTWAGLAWAFGFYAGNWHPLTWLSHMADCQLYGAWAGGHHLTSVLLHVATTLLIFLTLEQMTRAPWRSAAVAALFAWHPVHVESVAWVAERKDVLCAFFWMLSLWCYAKRMPVPSAAAGTRQATPPAVPGPHGQRLYLLSFIFFSCALLAKPMAVTLPFVLLLLDFWPLRRLGLPASVAPLRTLVIEKIPFLLLSMASSSLTLHAQQIAIVSTAGLTVPQRLAHTVAAYGHYLTALFLPLNLAVYYPYQIHLPPQATIVAGLILLLITMVAIVNHRQRPYLLFGWLWYLGTLVPVIGLVQVGDQAWADRYTYLPLIGPFIMLVWLAAETIRNRSALAAAFALVSAFLLGLTSLQIPVWKNTRTLFEHAEAVTRDNYLAITMLGSLLASEHKYDAAIECYQRALRYQPSFPEAHFFMGAALDEQGKLDEALAEYQQALWFKPTQEQTHIFMGMALGKLKEYDQAVAQYKAALKLNPDSAVAHNNLARILHSEGKTAEAIPHYRAALELDPKLALAHNNLGVLLIQSGKLDEGTAQLREALRLSPTNRETEFNLGRALGQQGQWNEAVDLLAKAAQATPADPAAHFQLATALAQLHRTREALSEYASALLLNQDYPDALDGLAWILSTSSQPQFRNGTEATKMAERACDLTHHQEPRMLKTLAAAYAETGRFSDAQNAIRTAKELAVRASAPTLAAECDQMGQSFGQSTPWRTTQ